MQSDGTLLGGSGSVDVVEMPLGVVVAGTYRIRKKLGVGSMGVVYLADDLPLARTVALKFLNPEVSGSPERRGLFRQEARALARLNHPGIVQVYTYGEEKDHPFFAMEYCEGKTLEQAIESKGRFSEFESGKILVQIAEALAAAHHEGITHRDLKPANVILPRSGGVKVMDFGLAGLALEATGRIAGTPKYMAPEQAQGKKADNRCDLYALGVIAFELLTGRVPFLGSDYRETLELHAKAPIPSIRERMPAVTEAFDRLVRELLEKHPDRRPALAEDVARRLRLIVKPPEESDLPSAERPEDLAQALYELAERHYVMKEFEAAKSRAEETVRVHPRHAGAQNLLGLLCLLASDHETAVKAFATAVACDIEYGDAYLNLGDVLERKGRHKEALWAYEKAVLYLPSPLAAFKRLAKIRTKLRDLPGALKAWEEALSIEPLDRESRDGAARLRKEMAI